MRRISRLVLMAVATSACRSAPNAVPSVGPATSPSLTRQSFVVTGASGHPVNVRATIAVTGDTLRRRPLPLVLSLHYSGPDTLPAFFGASLLERVVLPALAPLGAIFVAPDAPGRGWGSVESEAVVMALLDSLAAHYPIDARRTLVTGYSLGGMGTWYLASRHSDRFRAAIPMASLPVLQGDAFRPVLVARIDSMAAGNTTLTTQPLRQVPWLVLQSRADATMSFPAMARFVEYLTSAGVDAQLVALDSIQHHETVRYLEPLRKTMPWIQRQWGRR